LVVRWDFVKKFRTVEQVFNFISDHAMLDLRVKLSRFYISPGCSQELFVVILLSKNFSTLGF